MKRLIQTGVARKDFNTALYKAESNIEDQGKRKGVCPDWKII
jgi:hypothetical protein